MATPSATGMTRIGISLLAVALLALAAWLLATLAPGETPDTGGWSAASEEQVGTTARSGPHNPTEPGGVEPETERAAIATADDEREPLPPTQVELVVRVVHDGKPVPGAEVSYDTDFPDTDLASEFERQRARRLQLDIEGYLRSTGQTVMTDARGEAEVRLTIREQGSQSWMCARKGDLFGQVFGYPLTLCEDGCTIELDRDVSVAVRVTNKAGQPVARVPIVAAFDRLQLWRQEVRSTHRLVALSGEDGMATLPHMQTWRVHGSGGKRTVRVSLHIPGHECEGEAVQLDDLPEGPVELSCPPTGQILAVVTNGVGLSARNVSVILEPEAGADPRNLNGCQARPRPGRILYEHVALEQQWNLTAWFSTGEAELTLAGPVTAGQLVRAELDGAATDPLVTGRARSQRRTPLGNRVLVVDVGSQGDWVTAGDEIRTDADGRFHFIAPNEDEVDRFRFRIRNTDGTTGDEAADLAGRWVLEPGRNDLGDVVFTESPVLVAGRVVDRTNGEGVRSAMIELEYWVPDEDSEDRDGHWDSGDDLSTRSDGTGRFALRGAVPWGRLRVVVDSLFHRPPDPIDITAGQHGLEIALDPGGTSVAHALHDPLFPVVLLRATLVPEGHDDIPSVARLFGWAWRQPARAHRGRVFGMKEASCGWRWRAVPPGTYRLELRTYADPHPFHTVEGIEVATGQRTSDPRLARIDLRGRVRAVRIQPVSEGGQRIREGHVLRILREPVGALVGTKWRNGPATLLTAAPSIDVMLLARNYHPETVRDVRGDTTVRLRPLPRLRIAGTWHGIGLPRGSKIRYTLTTKRDPRDKPRAYYTQGYRRTVDQLLSTRGSTTQSTEVTPSTPLQLPAGKYTLRAHVRRSGSTQHVEVTPSEVVVTEAPDQVVSTTIGADGLNWVLFGRRPRGSK